MDKYQLLISGGGAFIIAFSLWVVFGFKTGADQGAGAVGESEKVSAPDPSPTRSAQDMFVVSNSSVVPCSIIQDESDSKSEKNCFAIDVETTGLHSRDRIVTLALVGVTGYRVEGTCYYAIFDPGKKSHPEAEKVHGWSDWTLRHQSSFKNLAAGFHKLLSEADMLIGHNIAFDLGFLNREFEMCGLPPISTKNFCTMLAYRDKFPGQRASLTACMAAIGLQRRSKTHNAIEDALMAANLYGWMHGQREYKSIPEDNPLPGNFVVPPPVPEGVLPRRKRLKKIVG